MGDFIAWFFLQIHMFFFSLFIFFVIIDIKKNRRRKEKIIIFIVFIIVTILFTQSNFVKSRKKVDKEWMIGKTVDNIRLRYAYPKDTHERFFDNTEPYILCTHEIYKWNAIDGIQGEYLYYVLLNDSGIVTDVKVYNYDEYGLMQPVSYWSRW